MSRSQVLPQKLLVSLSSASDTQSRFLEVLAGTYNLHDFTVGAGELLDALSGSAFGNSAMKNNEKGCLVC